MPNRARRPREQTFDIEIRVLRAVIALAERLSFTRTARKLHISQPALSKQIAELEGRFEFPLFSRTNKRVVELTDAGRVLVERAHSVVAQMELAVRLTRDAHEGHSNTLLIGHSPYADQSWVSTLLKTRLRTFSDFRVLTMTMFAPNLVQGVRTGELNLAIVTAPEIDNQIVATAFAEAPLYVAIARDSSRSSQQRSSLERFGE